MGRYYISVARNALQLNVLISRLPIVIVLFHDGLFNSHYGEKSSSRSVICFPPNLPIQWGISYRTEHLLFRHPKFKAWYISRRLICIHTNIFRSIIWPVVLVTKRPFSGRWKRLWLWLRLWLWFLILILPHRPFLSSITPWIPTIIL